ncbi:hypothetical protein NMY22_g16513 [Coprinellus aureogranulatus]|nr:hypothetical protein NMY22_g16513 [Coprinellus aureogranulatus]
MLVYDHEDIVLSSDDLKLARRWVARGVKAYKSRTGNDPRYDWVLMSGKHDPANPYFTVRGFDEAGWAQYTLHVHPTHTRFFDNGGNAFGWGFKNAVKMDFRRRVKIV